MHWRRKWQPPPVFLPGEPHGRGNLVGCRLWVHTELDTTERLHFHALEKEIATHSSVLAWRIPGIVKPGGLPSMWLHKVRHNWSDLAVAAAGPWQNHWIIYRRNWQCGLPWIGIEAYLQLFRWPRTPRLGNLKGWKRNKAQTWASDKGWSWGTQGKDVRMQRMDPKVEREPTQYWVWSHARKCLWATAPRERK